MDEEKKGSILTSQKNEITEHMIYNKLAQSTKDSQNRKILQRIAEEELEHYNFWKTYTNKDTKPDKLKVWMYFLIAKIFGITFAINRWRKERKKRKQPTKRSLSPYRRPKALWKTKINMRKN